MLGSEMPLFGTIGSVLVMTAVSDPTPSPKGHKAIFPGTCRIESNKDEIDTALSRLVA